MKRIIRIAAMAAVACAALSCNVGGFSEADFVTKITTVSLIKDGETVTEYNDAVHQLAWREKDLQFRLMDDNLNDYFLVTMSEMPTEMGQIIQAEVTYTTDKDVKTVSGSFNVSKLSSTSAGTYIWLWNGQNDLAVLIQIIR